MAIFYWFKVFDWYFKKKKIETSTPLPLFSVFSSFFRTFFLIFLRNIRIHFLPARLKISFLKLSASAAVFTTATTIQIFVMTINPPPLALFCVKMSTLLLFCARGELSFSISVRYSKSSCCLFRLKLHNGAHTFWKRRGKVQAHFPLGLFRFWTGIGREKGLYSALSTFCLKIAVVLQLSQVVVKIVKISYFIYDFWAKEYIFSHFYILISR